MPEFWSYDHRWISLQEHPDEYINAKFEDKYNKRYGKLIVVSMAYTKDPDAPILWECKCDCGKIVIKPFHELYKGTWVTSCGCDFKKGSSLKLSGTPTYASWRKMMSCKEVTPEWHVFRQFYHDMGDKKEGYMLIAKDPQKLYSKSNCEWAPIKKPKKPKNVPDLITFQGQSKSLSQWAKEYGISHVTLKRRLSVMKMDIATALLTPKKNPGYKT